MQEHYSILSATKTVKIGKRNESLLNYIAKNSLQLKTNEKERKS